MRYTIAVVEELNTQGPHHLRVADCALQQLRKGCKTRAETHYQLGVLRHQLELFERLFKEAEPFIKDS